jgi:hypothetical protein
MRVIRVDLWFCHDCLFAAVNDDYTGLDFSLSREKADARMGEIQVGLGKFGPNLVPDFDSETDDGIEEFSRRPCDCCGEGLAGGRHRFVVLGE